MSHPVTTRETELAPSALVPDDDSIGVPGGTGALDAVMEASQDQWGSKANPDFKPWMPDSFPPAETDPLVVDCLGTGSLDRVREQELG